jgi:hypothetical protein
MPHKHSVHWALQGMIMGKPKYLKFESFFVWVHIEVPCALGGNIEVHAHGTLY